jgi:hypothetical protein
MRTRGGGGVASERGEERESFSFHTFSPTQKFSFPPTSFAETSTFFLVLSFSLSLSWVLRRRSQGAGKINKPYKNLLWRIIFHRYDYVCRPFDTEQRLVGRIYCTI